MFPADFAYARARSLDEALDLLDEAAEAGDEAKLIAGGQSLLPMMKLRLAAPEVLIDIADLPELKDAGHAALSSGSGRLTTTIGALTTYRELARHPMLAGPGIPAVTDALAVLADPQVRARGTIGGAVAHGDPAADLPAVLLALDAEVFIASRPGRHEHTKSRLGEFTARHPHPDQGNAPRQMTPLDDFLRGIYETDLADDEIVTGIQVTSPGGTASAYEKFPHPASHLPLAGVAVVLVFKGGTHTDSTGNVTDLADGSLERAAIAVTGISPRPYRARAAEAVLAGAFPAPDVIAEAVARVTKAPDGGEMTLLGDQHASAGYRAHLAEVLTRRALAKALARAGHA